MLAPVEVLVKLSVYGPGPQKLTTGVVKLATTCGQLARAPNDQRTANRQSSFSKRLFNLPGLEKFAAFRQLNVINLKQKSDAN